MKKSHNDPSTDAQKNETKNKAGQKIKSKTSYKTNEDLGTMKIGKAHSMNDDDLVSTSPKEKEKK
jgi:hypothetical protein